MKYLIPALLLLLCLLTLLFPAEALSGCRDALAVFFESVLPALFPYYVLTGMLCKTALFHKLAGFSVAGRWLCFLLGGLAGYPAGARLSTALGREELAAGCNLCSPMFLLGVVSIAFYGDAAMFPVLAVSHYGTATAFLVWDSVFRDRAAPPCPAPSPATGKGALALLSDIGDGMLAMLRIGGCILFFSVMAKLLSKLLPGGRIPLFAALLSGGLEMTAGCAAVGALGLPGRVSAGLYAFFVTFGGLSVFAQTVMTARLRRPGRYLFDKLIQGFFAALSAYFLAPLFLKDTVAAASMTAQDYWNNALLSFAFFAAACLGLIGAYLFAQLFGGLQKRTRE